MCPLTNPIIIVGCGPGARSYLTLEAIDTVKGADVLMGAPRVLALFEESGAERIPLNGNIGALLDEIERRRHRQSVVVLVTGDPGIHSLAAPIVARFGARHCRLIPGISAVQLACARVGVDFADTVILSAHHVLPDISSDALIPFGTIAVLTGHPASLAWIQTLASVLPGDYRVILLENLSLEDECVRAVSVDALADETASPLSIVLITRRSVSV